MPMVYRPRAVQAGAHDGWNCPLCTACIERTRMITETEILAALEKPSAVYPLQQRLDPSSRSTDALQDLLLKMRAAGTVKFNIKTGKWSRA